ncbi:hypothetical protein KP509_01G124800 [Ceratopteris richardii]|nr:hypothetical protein KP509_01G124800 [Ceratopteris richardii]
MEAQNFTPAGQPIFYQMVIAPMRGTPTNEAVVEESLIKFAKVLDIHEERLAKAPYLGGESFSLADLTHMPLTHYLIGLPKVSDVFRARKNVMAWWERISSREAWKKVTALSA